MGHPLGQGERVAAFGGAGVTTVNAIPIAATRQHRVAAVKLLKEYAS